MLKDAAFLPQARLDGLIVNKVDEETLVYDRKSNRAHCLNPTASLVWRRCDGQTTAEEMAERLQEQLGVPVNEDVVWLAVKQLDRFHLLEPGRQMTFAPSVSRRTLMLKYAPAALALPLIMSITTPTAAQGGSCLPVDAQCAIDDQCCSFNCNTGTCGPPL